MRNKIPPPKSSREKPNISTTNSLISWKTPEKVKDILATGWEVSLPVKKRPFYPLWYTRELKNGGEKSPLTENNLKQEDEGELEE